MKYLTLITLLLFASCSTFMQGDVIRCHGLIRGAYDIAPLFIVDRVYSDQYVLILVESIAIGGIYLPKDVVNQNCSWGR